MVREFHHLYHATLEFTSPTLPIPQLTSQRRARFISITFHPFYGSQLLAEIVEGGQTPYGTVVSQPLSAACDLGLEAVVSHSFTSMKCVALL